MIRYNGSVPAFRLTLKTLHPVLAIRMGKNRTQGFDV